MSQEVELFVMARVTSGKENDPREVRVIWHPPLEDGETHHCGHAHGWHHPVFINRQTEVVTEVPDDYELPDHVLMKLDGALLDLRDGINQVLFSEIEDRG